MQICELRHLKKFSLFFLSNKSTCDVKPFKKNQKIEYKEKRIPGIEIQELRGEGRGERLRRRGRTIVHYGRLRLCRVSMKFYLLFIKRFHLETTHLNSSLKIIELKGARRNFTKKFKKPVGLYIYICRSSR